MQTFENNTTWAQAREGGVWHKLSYRVRCTSYSCCNIGRWHEGVNGWYALMEQDECPGMPCLNCTARGSA